MPEFPAYNRGSASPLDTAPPSPQAMGASPQGAPNQFSLEQIAPPLPSGMMPPEMLTAVLESAQNIGNLLDSYAQALPDLAPDFGQVKDLLQSVLAKVMIAGAQPISPTASGQQFPGGGFSRGIAGAGAV